MARRGQKCKRCLQINVPHQNNPSLLLHSDSERLTLHLCLISIGTIGPIFNETFKKKSMLRPALQTCDLPSNTRFKHNEDAFLRLCFLPPRVLLGVVDGGWLCVGASPGQPQSTLMCNQIALFQGFPHSCFKGHLTKWSTWFLSQN